MKPPRIRETLESFAASTLDFRLIQEIGLHVFSENFAGRAYGVAQIGKHVAYAGADVGYGHAGLQA